MLGKTLKYKDFNNQDVETTFYFNLTEAEIVELNIRDDLQAITQSGNANKLMDTFKRILKAAYGVRLAGGAKFVKTEQDWNEFVSGNGYSDIFMQMVTDADYAAAFMRELIPADVSNRVANQAQKTSETARANSEANMQGYNKPSESTQVAPHDGYTSRREAMNHEQSSPQQ